MIDITQCLRHALQTIASTNASYAVVGGIAMSAWGGARATRDVDFAVYCPTDRDAQRVIRHFMSQGYGTLSVLDHRRAKRIATIRFVPPNAELAEVPEESLLLDLIFYSCGIEDKVVQNAKTFTVLNIPDVKVADIPEMLAMKLVSVSPGRPKDTIDIHDLIKLASPQHLDRTRDLLREVTQKGFNSDRDLFKLLDQYISPIK